MRQFLVRIQPPFPHIDVQQRASSPVLAVRAALYFHGSAWARAVHAGQGTILCSEQHCPATYNRLVFTPGMRHDGQRIYRANPFAMIREGTKTTTVRRSRDMGDAQTGPDPYPAHAVGDLLEAAQGGMRSGLVVEVAEVVEYDAACITPEMAYNDGFTGDEAGARLMASFIAAEGGPMDLYRFRLRDDLSFWPEVQP